MNEWNNKWNEWKQLSYFVSCYLQVNIYLLLLLYGTLGRSRTVDIR